MSRRNPFEELERALERMSEQLETDLPTGTGGSVAVDVEDHGEEFVVTADLPGYDREEITVEVADDTLTLAAERDEEREESEGDYVRRERRRRSVRRTVALPAPVEESEASASYRNGVLTVTLPRRDRDEGGQTIDIE